ncbi:MAG: hypothetical protein GSR77_01510 [Desulfurococcales archaeon]|nr:hypothetical protein [Desulfurococcales archaeon]
MIETGRNHQYYIFTIVFPEKPAVKQIKLKGYAGLYKRIDILARAFIIIEQYARVQKEKQLIVHGVFPENDEIITILEYRPTGTIRREKQAVLEILKALRGKETSLVKREEPVDKYLRGLSKYYDLVYLSEKGKPIEGYSGKEKTVYVLGAHKDPPAMFHEALKRYKHSELSIGPHSYLATHVIAYILWRSQSSISLDKSQELL